MHYQIDSLKRKIKRPTFWILLSCLLMLVSLLPGHATPQLMPLDILGGAGDSAQARFTVANEAQLQAMGATAVPARLVMQITGVKLPDQISVQLNGGTIKNVNNTTCDVNSKALEYGGVGGPIRTFTIAMRVACGEVLIGQQNIVTFRILKDDGITSGFQLLSVNIEDGQTPGKNMVPATEFIQDDPDTWTPPRNTTSDIATGKTLWNSAVLKESVLRKDTFILATCSDCHAKNGRDLKYFNFTNSSIIQRSLFHGLTQTQGEQIASYIRSQNFIHPGTPWDPPYQPGPLIDSAAIDNWAAGAGLGSIVTDDNALTYLIAADALGDTAYNATLNTRTIPIEIPLLAWAQWLPENFPGDSFSDFKTPTGIWKPWQMYQTARALVDSGTYTTAQVKTALNNMAVHMQLYLRTKEPPVYTGTDGKPKQDWTRAISLAIYNAGNWEVTKEWELIQDTSLETKPGEVFPGSHERQTWPTGNLFINSPTMRHLVWGPQFLSDSEVFVRYLNSAWYYLQNTMHPGNQNRFGNNPMDWPYTRHRLNDESKASLASVATRAAIIQLKGIQEGRVTTLNDPIDIIATKRADYGADITELWNPSASPQYAKLTFTRRSAVKTMIMKRWMDWAASFPASSLTGTLSTDVIPDTLNFETRFNNLGVIYMSGGNFATRCWASMHFIKKTGELDSTQTARFLAFCKLHWPSHNWDGITGLEH